MTDVKELEKLEKIQEKIVKKKKAHTEKAKEKGDLKSIEKAQTEENEAIAVLEKIREDKRRAEAGSEKQENSSQAQSEKVMMEGEKILKTLKPSRWAYFWWYSIGVIWLIFVGLPNIIMGVVLMEYSSIAALFLVMLSLGIPVLIIVITELVRRGNTYYITDRRTIHDFRFLKRDFSSTSYDKIQDLRITQGIIERMVGIGTIHINTAGTTFIEIRFKGISNPFSVKRTIEERTMSQG